MMFLSADEVDLPDASKGFDGFGGSASGANCPADGF
jgi:hypothetical protein